MLTLSAKFLDGTEKTIQATGWMSMGDRVAFERQFQMSTAALTQFIPQEGETAPDLTQLREEWIAFFAWREMRRHGIQDDFDSFLDRLMRIEVGKVETNGAVVHENPTVPDPQLTS